MSVQWRGVRRIRGSGTPASRGAMTCSRRVSRALMMRAAAGEMRYRRGGGGFLGRGLSPGVGRAGGGVWGGVVAGPARLAALAGGAGAGGATGAGGRGGAG